MPKKQRIEFGVFDKTVHTDQSIRRLPHWFQPGVATFVTFRTKDSMPKHVVADWHREIREWLRSNNLPRLSESPSVGNNDSQSHETIELPPASAVPKQLRAEYLRVKSEGWNHRLDNCHGKCVLRNSEIANIVGDTLMFFDGNRYDVSCFVVMPNHVHILFQFRDEIRIAKQTESWLRYSAREINKQLAREGAFWQSEPFDHLVRSEEQFVYLRNYIRENPQKARLNAGEYLHYES